MQRAVNSEVSLTPEIVLAAYAQGIFPMAEAADDPQVFWMRPRRRGVIPLRGSGLVPGRGLHVARSLRRTLRRRLTRDGWTLGCDGAFDAVMDGCAARAETWINAPIRRVFAALHRLGHAHSVELHDPDGALAGGVYGLAMGGAFFAESMFSARRDGSKIALAELVARLEAGGFALLDTQYLTGHLASLGGIEVSDRHYATALAGALVTAAHHDVAFGPAPPDGAFCLGGSGRDQGC